MELITTGTTRLAADANKSFDEAAHFNIRQQSTPNMTLAVGPGVANINGTIVKYAGGNTSTFTAPTSNPRIDLIYIDSSGALGYITGTEAASPTAPNYPADKLVIAEIYHRVGETSLKWKDDSINGYLYRFSALRQRGEFRDFVLGETLSVNDAVALRTNDEKYLNIVNKDYTSIGSYDVCYGSYISCQTFLTSADCDKIRGVRMSFALDSNAQYNKTYYVELYAVDGSNNPTGSALASVSGHLEGMNGTKHEVYFSLEYDCSPNTTYALILRSTGTTISDSARWYQGSSYTDGTAKKSTDGGSSWTAQAYDYGFDVIEECIEDDIINGRVYKTDADYEGQRIENFVGFVIQAGSAGDTRQVQISGIIDGLSGLTAGDKYFLSNTAGAITNSISSATYPFEVGIAISATQLLLNPKKKQYKKYENLTGSALSFDGNDPTNVHWKSFGVPIQAREGDKFIINYSLYTNIGSIGLFIREQGTTKKSHYYYLRMASGTIGSQNTPISGSFLYEPSEGVNVINAYANGWGGWAITSMNGTITGYLEVIKL